MYKLKIVELPKPLNIKTQINFPEVVLGKMQEKTVKPKTTFQEILPDKNYDGLSKVNVEAVTNEIDTNIKSENIKKDVSILGVQGNIEELKGTKLEITKNGTYTPEEPYNAFTEVEANMEPDVSEYFTDTISKGTAYNNGGWLKTIKKFPAFTVSGTDASYMFASFPLTTIPQLDTSNVTNMSQMFVMASNLTTIPKLNTSKVTNMLSMFNTCSSLITIPLLDTSNVTDISQMFRDCSKLTTIPQLNTSKVTNMYMLFRNCTSLESVPLLDAHMVTWIEQIFYNISKLTTLGGLQNLGQAYSTTASANYRDYKLSLSNSLNLTHDSLMNVINNLYDIATKGVKTQQLVLGSDNIAKLTADEIAIATNKGFSVS